MVTADSVKAKLQSLIDSANETTGGSDTDLTTAIATLIAGFGSGGSGNAIQIGQETPANILNIFYLLENGLAKYGEFTTASYLPATATLIFQSGLEEIKGYMIIDADWETGVTSNEYTVFGLYHPDAKTVFNISNRVSSDTNLQYVTFGSAITRCSITIEGGDLYVTANFGGNYGYTPFMINHRYIWVAW